MSLRRSVISAAALTIALTASSVQAQQSNGLTFYHLADSTAKDGSGNVFSGIKSGPQTDGNLVAFESGTANTACDSAASLYAVPVTGGSVSTLGGPGIAVETAEPSGTTTTLCNRLVLSGSTLFYPANYTPTGGSQRGGIFRLPLAGGASADAIATGDATPVESFQTSGGTRVTQPGAVTSVATTTFSADTSGNLIANYFATFTAGGPYSFNTLANYGGYPNVLGGPGLAATSVCPGVTVPLEGGAIASGLTVGMESGYAENAPWYADLVTGSGTNYAGSSVPMQFIQVGVLPYFGGCDAVIFGPDFGSLNGNSTYILPGEPLPNTSTQVSSMQMEDLAVFNGTIYLSASQTLSSTQGSYSGIFVVTDNYTGASGSQGAFPLPNGVWPSSSAPITTKVISNYDSVPGITPGVAACSGGVSQIPVIGPTFTVSGNYLVFTESQTLQNCTTMATSAAGGIYAYNLTTQAVQLVAPYNASLVLGDGITTGFSSLVPGALSADGHLAFVASTQAPGASAATTTLYSAYLSQIVTAVSLTASGSTISGGSVTLTARVSPNTGAASQAGGSVRFFDGTTLLGTQAIDSNGNATLSVTSLSAGLHSLHAVYTGDALYEGATSASASLSNGKASPVLTVTSGSTAFIGESVTLTAQLSSAAAGTPTGVIAFTSNGAALGAATIGSGGSAVLTVPNLSAGSNQIVASYAGDSNFNGAVSAPASVLILNGNSLNFLSPVTLAFPAQAVGTTSSAQTVTLVNYNGSPLPVSSITISGNFAQTNTCGTSVSSGNQCVLHITFAPQSAGNLTGVLTVVSGTGGVSTQTVALSGTTLSSSGSTTTAIYSSGAAGNYTLTGTVIGLRSTDAPTGDVSFVDVSNNNLSLGATVLGASTPGYGLSVFSPPTIGMGPDALVVGDFNGDGKADIATANSGYVGGRTAGGPPTVLFGNGDGTFTATMAPVTATNPVIIATGDFNNDGKMDIVADGGTDGALLIYLNSGNGTFTVAPIPVTNFDPSFVAVGDFNGDGFQDIAAANGTNAVTLYFGNGNATFTQGPTYATGQYPSSIAVADFNRDGKLDLAVQGSVDGSITVLLNAGNGTFTPAAAVSSAAYPSTLVTGDFNGDGKPDLATASQNSSDVNVVTVLLGNGDGTFNSVTTPTTDGDTETYSVTPADFNGDGKTDLALADDENVSILLSNGDGTFTLAGSVMGATTAPNYFPVTAADLNGDGIPDIATANSDLNTVGVYLTQRTQTAVATLNNVSVPGTGTHNIQAVYAGDTNFSTSSSSTIPLTASLVAPVLQLASSSGSVTSGTQVTLTATLSPYTLGSNMTTGETVTFYNNGTSIGTGALTSGVAMFSTASLPQGSNSLTAVYGGDANFSAATAAAVSVVVTAPSVTPVPAVTLSVSSLTFAAETVGVTSAAQSVTLTNSGQAVLMLSSIAVSGDFAETNNCGTSVAPGASCTIAVTFTPTTTGTRSGAVSITDNAAGSPQSIALSGGGAAAVTLSPGSTSLAIGAVGGTSTTTIQLTPVAGFTGTVSLTCAVSYQGQGTPTDPPTCSLSPAQVQVSGSSPISSTLTISTTAASAAVSPGKDLGSSLVALAGLFFLGTVPRKRWRGGVLFAGLCLIALGGVLGCGGSGNSGSTNTPPPVTNPGTSTGSYQVVVTGTSGASKVTATIPLSVQ